MMRAFLILVVAGLPLMLMGIWLLEQTRQSRPSKPLGFLLTIAVVLVVSSAAYLNFPADQSAALRESHPVQQVRASNPVLAVLPFANMSSLETNVHLADGLTEDIITLLAQSPGVEVIARNSTFKYKGQNPDIRDVERDLGADYMIEGSVRPLGENIRVTLQVIDAGSGEHMWADKYDRPLADFFEIEDEVSLGIAAAVGDAVFKEEHSEIALSRTDNLTAWALVSQAEMAFSHFVTGDENGVAKARQAAKLDPDDPKVNAFLAFTLLTTGQPVEALPYAERVPKISPSYAEGLAYYGDILTHNGQSRE